LPWQNGLLDVPPKSQKYQESSERHADRGNKRNRARHISGECVPVDQALPRIIGGLPNDLVRDRFRQVRFRCEQNICGEAIFFILLFLVILSFCTGALTGGETKGKNRGQSGDRRSRIDFQFGAKRVTGLRVQAVDPCNAAPWTHKFRFMSMKCEVFHPLAPL